MDFKEIQELIKLINKSNITEFKYAQGDFKLTIRSKDSENIVQQVIHQAAPLQIAAPVAMPAPVQVSAPAAAPVVAAPAPAAAVPTPPAPKAGLLEIKSPIVGTFYRSPSPDKKPYVEVGTKISVGMPVCIVEAMKLFNEIESEYEGTIVEVLVNHSSPVEYDQVLFLVAPNK